MAPTIGQHCAYAGYNTASELQAFFSFLECKRSRSLQKTFLKYGGVECDATAFDQAHCQNSALRMQSMLVMPLIQSAQQRLRAEPKVVIIMRFWWWMSY